MQALLILHLSEEREETGLYERHLVVLICLQPLCEVQHGKGAREGIHSLQGVLLCPETETKQGPASTLLTVP